MLHFAAVAAMGLTAFGESPTASFETTKVGGFTVTAGVEGLGAGESRTLWLAWGRSADKLLYTNEIGTVTGEETATLSVTEKAFPGRDNYAKVLVCDTTGAITGESAAPIAFYVAGTGDAAPRGYKFLDYIESTGKQRVNLELNIWHTWGTEYDFHFGHLQKDQNVMLFGQYTWYRFGINGSYQFFFVNGVTMSPATVVDPDADYVAIARANDPTTGMGGTVTLTNLLSGEVTGPCANDKTFDWNNGKPVYMFGSPEASYGQKSAFRFYSLRCYQKSEMVAHYLPAVDTANNAGGVIDIKTAKFHPDEDGVEPFVLGGDHEVVLGASVIDGASRLTITGAAGEYGAPDPAYGTYDAIGNGNVIECFAPAAVTNGDDIAVCAGWKIYATEGDRSVGWELVSEGEGNFCRYVHPTDRRAKLVWQWRRASEIAKVEFSTATAGGFDVSVDVAGYGLEADDALTFELAWGYAPDLLSFTKTIGTADEIGAVGTHVDGAMPGQTHYAKVFGYDKDGNLVYESAAPIAFHVAGSGDVAPAGITFLDYIESTGKQRVDPNYVIANQSCATEFDIHFGRLQTANYTTLFGQRGWYLFALDTAGRYNLRNLLDPVTVNDPTVDYFAIGRADYPDPASGQSKVAGSVTITNLWTGESVGPAHLTQCLDYSNSEGPVYIFGRNNTTNYRGAYRFYSLRAYRRGEVVYDLVAAKNADGEGGLWDAKAHQFYGDIDKAAADAEPFGLGNPVEVIVGGGVIKPESKLTITGVSHEYGAAQPAYGTYEGLLPGHSFACSVPAAVTNGEVIAKCVGWTLYTNAVDDAETWIVASEGTENALVYSQPEGSAAKLVWWWREAPSYANVSIKTDSVGAFKVSLDVTGYGYEADDTLTLALAWGRSPDALVFTNVFGTVSDFVSLSISEPAGRAIPGQTHYAKVFGLDKGGKVVCEDAELRAFHVAGTGDTAPAGYKFLDYVESTGKQHVDLGPNSNSLNDKIGTDYELRFGHWTVNTKDNGALFGQRSSAKNALQLKSNGMFEIGGVTFSAATPNDIYVFRTVDMGSSGSVDVGPVEITSETTGESVRKEGAKLDPVNDNMHLFTYRSNDSRGATSYRFYSMKMWLDKVLKYYLVPAQRLDDGEAGLWNAVDKTFYVNTYDAATAQPFGAGDEVELKLGAGTVLPESTLIVTGTALGVAGLDPTYGTYEGIPAGASFPCYAPAAISDETMQSGCSGWILYTNATDNAEVWIEWKRGDGNTLDYTHPEGTAAKLEWQITAKFKATVSAAEGGQITIDGGEPTGAWSGWMDAGEVHVIVPVAPDGASFAYWQGNMPVEQETDSPLALTLDGVKTVTAHFMTGAVARWKGSASNTSASKADNWADGVLPTDGAKIVLGGGATGMTWDLKTVTPGGWWQMANYGQTVTFQTTFEGEGYPVLNIGGDVLLESGTWTHTGNPTQKQNNDPRSIYRISVDATGDFTVGANAKIDVMGRGYVDHRYGSDSNVLFYGSIVCPTNYGMATIRQTAPGAVRLVVGGEFHLDGLVSASSEQPNENSDLAATGGSIWITAGTMSGSGAIKANAGYTTKNASKTNVGSGGRISLMLTEPGADFSDFHATVTAWGAIIPGSGHSMYAKAGTVYWQTGDEQFGRGTVVVANDPESQVSEADLSPNTWLLPRQWCDPKELKYARIVIGAKSGVTLTGDLEVRDLVLEADTSALDLAGHTLRVHSAFHRYPTGHVTNAGEPTMKGKNFRNVVWSQPLALIVR